MKTTIYTPYGGEDGEKDNLLQLSVAEMAGILKRGGVAIFPTETVYGIGANALDETACLKIFTAKNRPPEKGLLCHVASLHQAEEIAYLTEKERILIGKFTPGPLTVIAKKKPVIGMVVSGGGGTVGLRFPSNKEAVGLITAAGFPVAASSANISGETIPTDPEGIKKDFLGKVDAILDCGNTGSGTPSTIVSLLGGEIKVIREGGISLSQIKKALE
ncbi:MAG: L-threonylcarbamoyladenylate synthase [Eubacteriales bacterium]|jgi:L-threonylcarbamoyladenylate synthase